MTIYRGWGESANRPPAVEQFNPTVVSRTQLVAAPQGAPVTVQEGQDFLKLDGNSDSALVTSMIAAATVWAETYTGLTFMPRTLRQWNDFFPQNAILSLLGGPVTAVTAVKYFLEDDSENLFAATNYLVDTVGQPARIVIHRDVVMPTVLRAANAWSVDYVCGYADAGSVPAAIKEAIKQIVAQMYEARGTQQDAAAFQSQSFVPAAALMLLSPYQMVKGYDEGRQATV